MRTKTPAMRARLPLFAFSALPALLACFGGCSRTQAGGIGQEVTTVGVTRAARKPMMRQLTLSSELVPYQEIDVYAKESGFVKDLLVDYGTRSRAVVHEHLDVAGLLGIDVYFLERHQLGRRVNWRFIGFRMARVTPTRSLLHDFAGLRAGACAETRQQGRKGGKGKEREARPHGGSSF